jgi:opacity protein-like surface antigen
MFALVSLASLLAAPAFAGAPPPPPAEPAPGYGRTGPYLGIAGGVVIPTALEDELEDATGVGWEVGASGSVHARVGYRLHPHFALEAHFEYLTEYELEAFGTTVAEIEAWTVGLDGKLPVLTGRAQPFLLIGLGAMHAELEDTIGLGISEEDTGFAARFGGGVDFYATRELVVGMDVSYVLPTGDVEDLDYVSIGIGFQYRF